MNIPQIDIKISRYYEYVRKEYKYLKIHKPTIPFRGSYNRYYVTVLNTFTRQSTHLSPCIITKLQSIQTRYLFTKKSYFHHPSYDQIKFPLRQ